MPCAPHGTELLGAMSVMEDEGDRSGTGPGRWLGGGRDAVRHRAHGGEEEPLASLRAELRTLREENTRLNGPVPRESLVELCRELERSMVAFEAKLDALAAAPVELNAERLSERANRDGSTGG
jgi:hypothetical protein